MERHEVFNNREYKGYYRLSNDIMDDLYEDEVFDWEMSSMSISRL